MMKLGKIRIMEIYLRKIIEKNKEELKIVDRHMAINFLNDEKLLNNFMK